MRVIFINPPRIFKYLITFISLFYKERFFLNNENLELSNYLIKKNINPIDFSNIKTRNIKDYIFGNKKLYRHTKSFFFKNFETYLKKFFSSEISKKILILAMHEKIIPLSNYSLRLSIWLETQKRMETTVFFFNSDFFYTPNINNKTKKVIIPIDFFLIDVKNILKKLIINKDIPKKNIKNKNISKFHKKSLLYIVNQSLIYGSKVYKLYQKDLLIDNKSRLKKRTDIFIFGQNRYKIKLIQLVNNFFFSTNFLIISLIKVKNFKNFLLVLYFYKLIFRTNNFINHIKEKNYSCCYVDYDILLPSYIYFALKILKIKVFSYQERFNLGFETHRISIFTDHYFTNNLYQIKNLKKSNYITAKSFQPLKQIRSELIRKFTNKNKKIITIFGYNTSNNQIKSMHEPLTSFKVQDIFLNDCIALSRKFNDYKFILRFKSLEWLKNNYFKKTLGKLKKSINIEISRNYNFNESYKLCANSQLIICRWTSLIDEALAAGKKVLIYDYAGNSSPITQEYFNYNNKIICKNFIELQEKIDLLTNRKKSFNDFIPKNKLIKYYGKLSNNKDYTKISIRNKIEKYLLKKDSNK